METSTRAGALVRAAVRWGVPLVIVAGGIVAILREASTAGLAELWLLWALVALGAVLLGGSVWGAVSRRRIRRLLAERPDAAVVPSLATPALVEAVAAVSAAVDAELGPPAGGLTLVVDAAAAELWTGTLRPRRWLRMPWSEVVAVEPTAPGDAGAPGLALTLVVADRMVRVPIPLTGRGPGGLLALGAPDRSTLVDRVRVLAGAVD